MRGLEKAMEWLRPLVEKKTWDYCVVWKLGDDPSRFVEWMDCCCGGGYGLANVKVEREGQHLPPLCRDRYSQHPVRTRACEALAQFPSFMPLYSGIHGEVVVSTQPRWLSHGTALDSNLSHELVGTQVLIPVVGGLIELFIAKHVPKDQNIIDFVTAQCHISSEQEVRSCNSVSPNENSLDPLLGKYGDNLPPPLLHLSSILQLQFLPPATQPSMYGFEGSSNVSDRLNEHPSFDSSSCLAPRHKSLKRPIEKSSFSIDHHYNETLLKQQLGLGLGLVSATPMVEKENEKARQKPESEQYHSKNLITERNRRNRIKDGLFTLRALVPKISKMDRASILGDAIQYIVELQQEVKKLQDEVNMEQEGSNMKDAELKRSSRYSPATTTEHNRGSSSIGEKKQIESQRVQVEVKLIGTREFLLKLLCEQKRGGFARLMEAINVLGLQVVDANITTFNGKVLNIFRVEANKEFQPKKLRDSLIDLTG
ncbi:transcription factor bHLH90 isoform X2 [Vitis riparia]|uniref:transcription factor bHLH90 isoform X2 n=1 Tax=Vitis riparia TaxID=96939 RepID=UPI00155A1AC5|nr:transcription factor bHLH90 isoform X2 [Vitis riparia]